MKSSWVCFRTQTCEPRSGGLRWSSRPEGVGAELQQTVVAMITSKMARSGPPSRVTVAAGSVADNLATVRYTEIDCVIGAFAELDQIDAALRATLGL